eukprot:COSAG01_NODE_37837_length_498_cov_0.829574_1_plen_119_part_10
MQVTMTSLDQEKVTVQDLRQQLGDLQSQLATAVQLKQQADSTVDAVTSAAQKRQKLLEESQAEYEATMAAKLGRVTLDMARLRDTHRSEMTRVQAERADDLAKAATVAAAAEDRLREQM